jgi:hypothetical protein
VDLYEVAGKRFIQQAGVNGDLARAGRQTPSFTQRG